MDATEHLNFHDTVILRSSIIGIGKRSHGSPAITKDVVVYTIGGPIVVGTYANQQGQDKGYAEALRLWQNS